VGIISNHSRMRPSFKSTRAELVSGEVGVDAPTVLLVYLGYTPI